MNKTIRLLVPACKAKPSPAIGQALASVGVNMMKFCKDFNDRTKQYKDEIPVRVSLRARTDGTFEYSTAIPSTSWFLKRAAGVDKGAADPGSNIVGKVHVKYIYEIAKLKQQDSKGQLRVVPLEKICRSIYSQMKTMGLAIDKTPGL